MIFDTNAVSALLDGDETAGNLRPQVAALPVIVVAEYLYGLRDSKFQTQLTQRLKEFERDCRLLVPNRRTAEHYADIRFALKKIGKPIPANDLWIAALAREHGLPLLRSCPVYHSC